MKKRLEKATVEELWQYLKKIVIVILIILAVLILAITLLSILTSARWIKLICSILAGIIWITIFIVILATWDKFAEIANNKLEVERLKRKTILKEKFSERKTLGVTPISDLSDIWAAVINELETNDEIFFLAELDEDDICIHIEMKNGKVYKNVLHSTDAKWFEENFQILGD